TDLQPLAGAHPAPSGLQPAQPPRARRAALAFPGQLSSAMWCRRLRERMPRPDTTGAAPVLVVTAGESDFPQVDRGLGLSRSKCCRSSWDGDLQFVAVFPDQLAGPKLLG